MSTRAYIRINDGGDLFQLYHHHDGYPDGVGAMLKDFLKKQYKQGGWYGDEIANDLVKGKLTYEHKDLYGKKMVDSDDEYEITSCIHGDEEYVYVIDCDEETLKCYRHGLDEGEACIKPENEVEIPELNEEEK